MSSDLDRRHQTHVEYAQRTHRRQQTYDQKEEVEETITKCARLLMRDDLESVRRVADELDQTLLPLLLTARDKEPEDYTADLAEHDYWYHHSLHSFYTNTQQYFDALSTAEDGDPVAADLPTRHEAMQTVKQALMSCVAIAEQWSYVSDEYSNKADVVGAATKLGEWRQDESMDIGDPVYAYMEGVVGYKTLHCGGTHQGKSTGLENEAWDYYQRNFRDDCDDMKVIDLVGFRQGENWTVDVPQQQDDLRRVRENLGLEPAFDESDVDEDPTIELFHPLVTNLPEVPLPYDTDADAFVPKPFTIPASELRQGLLVALIDARLTQSQEATLRNIYSEVDSNNDDWALADIAEAIRRRETLSDKDKDAAIGALKSLQERGFIRTKSCPYTLDWEDIFHDTATMTLFSQALCEDKVSQLITVAYLADAIFTRRKKMARPPWCVLVMREFWEVAPHSERQTNDREADAILDVVASMTSKLVRQNRHIRADTLCDTQAPGDLLKSVREQFNRFVIYALDYDTVKDIFDWTLNNRSGQFSSTMSQKPGEAGIVGQVQGAIDNRHIEFYSPVSIAPPPHHHFDVEVDGTGWHARVKYHDHEELRRPIEVDGVTWRSMPEHLEIQSFAEIEAQQEAPDPQITPIRAFIYECIGREHKARTKKREVYEAFNAFARAHGLEEYDFDDQSDLTTFTTRFSDRVEGPVDDTKVPSDDPGRDRENAYVDLVLTDKGQNYLE